MKKVLRTILIMLIIVGLFGLYLKRFNHPRSTEACSFLRGCETCKQVDNVNEEEKLLEKIESLEEKIDILQKENMKSEEKSEKINGKEVTPAEENKKNIKPNENVPVVVTETIEELEKKLEGLTEDQVIELKKLLDALR